MNKYFKTNLEYREIQRDQDIDYFIETDSYPINMEHELPFMSRIQFPKSRAILVRTCPDSLIVTIHIMRDIDLHSSFANFVIDLKDRELKIWKCDGFISVAL
ncbi:MAG: hypothetical protein ACRCTE_12055 [Cellulosilyticaceae bacterium]